MLSVSRLVASTLNKLGPVADRDHGHPAQLFNPLSLYLGGPDCLSKRKYNFGGETEGCSSQQYHLTGFFSLKPEGSREEGWSTCD